MWIFLLFFWGGGRALHWRFSFCEGATSSMNTMDKCVCVYVHVSIIHYMSSYCYTISGSPSPTASNVLQGGDRELT
jgi:hypothetical protein